MEISILERQLHNKKILITGGSGFLGSHLIPQVKQVSRQVNVYQKDIREIGGLSRAYDLVFHLAAFNKIGANTSPELLFDINVNGTLAVLRYCQRSQARCIFASSSAVYKPTTQKTKLKEDSLLAPVSLYGVSKMLAEGICKYYAENCGLSITALRIFNMYGPGQQDNFLIPYVLGQLSRARTVTLRSPKSVRDFVHVSDVARAFVLAALIKHKGFLALNLGSGQGVAVYDLVKKIALHMGIRAKIHISGTKKHRKDYVVARLSNTSKLLDWNSQLSIDQGLRTLL